MGRKTNGGLVITSKPLRAATGLGLAVNAGVLSGDADGDGDGLGDGDAGTGVGATRVNVAHGLGGTLAQSL